MVRRSCAKVARLHAVGQVSDLPVAASLRARLPGTLLKLDEPGEPKAPGTGGSAAVALARCGRPTPHLHPVRWQALIFFYPTWYEPHVGCCPVHWK